MGGSKSKMKSLKTDMDHVQTAMQELQKDRTELEKTTQKLQKELQRQEQIVLRLIACTRDNSKAIESLDHEMECLDVWYKN